MAQARVPVYQAANRSQTNGFLLVFQLQSPRRMAQVLARYSTDAYCEREALLEARAAQPITWQQEFDFWCRQWGVPLGC